MQSPCHRIDQSLGRGDVGPVHRHAPGPRRAGVGCVANCAAQCSGDGVAFRAGAQPGGMGGECATGGAGTPTVSARSNRAARSRAVRRARMEGRV